MGRHILDHGPDLLDSFGRARMFRVEDPHGVHQLLDGYGGMIDLPDIEEVGNCFRRTALQAVYVDAGI